jgi:hypothetical protein
MGDSPVEHSSAGESVADQQTGERKLRGHCECGEVAYLVDDSFLYALRSTATARAAAPRPAQRSNHWRGSTAIDSSSPREHTHF